jgi:hypothetical protein
MDSNIKSLTITGSAAEDATRSRLKGRPSRKLKTVIKDDEDEKDEFTESVKKFVQPVTQQVPSPVVRAVVSPIRQDVISPTQPAVRTIISHSPQPVVQQSVILKPPKQQRVKLQPKIQAPILSTTNTTRKARRIHLNTGNLAQRFTRAKKVKDETEKKSIVNIRDYLLQKGVIQQKSKAPEKILRSMYADFMLLNDHAL